MSTGSQRHQIFRRFWTEFLERAKEKTRLYAAVSPGDYHWIGTSPGKRGLGLNLSITQHAAAAELYIDRGRGADEENVRIFDQLHEAKDEIERIYGGPLEWLRLENRRACRIVQRIELGGYRDEERWHEIQDAMINAMVPVSLARYPLHCDNRSPSSQKQATNGRSPYSNALANPGRPGNAARSASLSTLDSVSVTTSEISSTAYASSEASFM